MMAINHGLQPLPDALRDLTRPFDWDALAARIHAAPGVSLTENARLVDTRGIVPNEQAYGWFHRNIDLSAVGIGLLSNWLAATSDEDRLHFAEDYAKLVLKETEADDASFFRRGVWLKENIPAVQYAGQRDHSVHTLNNYLLGWYLFVNSDAVRDGFRSVFERRGSSLTHDGSLFDRFGEIWCFASLLHDIGYLFEGAIPERSLELIDQGIRHGADWVTSYFRDGFWKEVGLRRADERKAAMQLGGFDPSELTAAHSADAIANFLRDLGSLDGIRAALDLETRSSVGPLPSDAFTLWTTNYRAFDQPAMAERMEGLEEAFYALIEKGIPPSGSVRVLDHGVCGGLLLLKWSTFWHRLAFTSRAATPTAATPEAAVKEWLLREAKQWRLSAKHWWSGVVWATAAVALHNVQQNSGCPGWRKRLEFSEDPLTYLGVLVDLLQEWDRPSARRVGTVGGSRRRLNAADVRIGRAVNGKIVIEFRCRDYEATQRQSKMTHDLDVSLADWDRLVSFSFCAA